MRTNQMGEERRKKKKINTKRPVLSSRLITYLTICFVVLFFCPSRRPLF